MLHAQITWLNPRPLGNNLGGIAYKDSLTAVVVGTKGALLNSFDGGNNWRVVFSGGQFDFTKVYCFNNRFYALDGSIRVSDNGSNWELLYANNNHIFKSISFVDETNWIAWAPGNLGDNLAFSSNAGKSWQFEHINALDKATQVHFSNALHGIAKTDYDILKTSDGGQTWIKILGFSDEGDYGIGFYAVSNDLIFVYSRLHQNHGGTDYGFIWRTNDGGTTWERVVNGYQLVDGMFFLDSLNGFASCSVENIEGWYNADNKLLTTIDGGLTWIEKPMPDRSIYKGIYSTDGQNIQLVGDDGSLAVTMNGGQNWIIKTHGFSSGGIYVLKTLGNNGLIMLADTLDGFSSWYRSNDKGISWIKSNNAFYQEGLSFSDSLNGFIIDAKIDTILTYYTSDGGYNWQLNKCPSTYYPSYNAYTPTPGVVFSKVPFQSSFCFSTDYGKTYVRRDLPADGILSFASMDTAYLAVMHPTQNAVVFYKTTDRGLTWTEELLWVSTDLTKVKDFEVFSPKFWVLGLAGTNYLNQSISELKLTSDGGKTWINVTPFGQNYGPFGFNSKGQGRIMLNNTTLYTPDAGYTWITDNYYFPKNYLIETNELGESYLYGYNHLLKVDGPIGPYALPENGTREPISVSPNPANDHIIFNLKCLHGFTGTLTIYNTTGNKLFSTDILCTKQIEILTLNTRELLPGLYIYKLTDGITSQLGKFVIVR